MTIAVDIVTTYVGKGAKQAENGLDKLNSLAKKATAALGLAYGVRGLIQFGKSAVQEFAKSDAAASQLLNTMKNMGLALDYLDVSGQLKSLSQATGVAGVDLTNYFQTLLRATNSSSKSIDALNTSIEIARGTTTDLGTVIEAVSKAYAGNKKSITALNTGLAAQYIQAAKVDDIMKTLSSKFKGSNAAYLDTYRGKLDLLNNSFNDSKEIIGRGIVMALENVNGKNGLQGTIGAFNELSLNTAAATANMGAFLGKIQAIPFANSVVSGWAGILKLLSTGKFDPFPSLDVQNQIWKENTKQLEEFYKIQAEQKKQAEAYAASLAQQKKLIEAQGKIKKAQSLFDINKIQIIAALQGKISEDEKTRLELQFAILQENADEADRLSQKLIISQGQTTGLAAVIAGLPKALNPFADYPAYINEALKQLALLQEQLAKTSSLNLTLSQIQQQSRAIQATQTQVTPSNAASVLGNYPAALNEYQAITGAMQSLNVRNGGNLYVNLNVEGSVTSESDLAETIRQKLLNSNLSGSPSAIGRLLGQFAP